MEFPWRPLGGLLVERGLITQTELEDALAEQASSERRLGEVLVARGSITVADLATVLAEQHGVELHPRSESFERHVAAAPEARGPAPWVPLGRLLVDKGVISQIQLDDALAENRRSGRLLGEILVARDWISTAQLVTALAEQHGVEVEVKGELTAELVADAEPAATRFVVMHARGGQWEQLRASTTFLDATDFAFDLLYDSEPEALEIVRFDGDTREVVWTYSRDGAAQTEKSSLIDLYGFPVNKWNAAPWLSDKQ